MRAKRPVAWTTILLLCAPCVFSAAPDAADTHALPARESLNYTIEWRLITAGKAQLEWAPLRNVNGDGQGWQANLHLESTGLVSKLFKVNDNYSSKLAHDLCAQSSYIDAQEGNRHRETVITFDREDRKASYREKDLLNNSIVASKEIDVPACVHDVVGGLFKLRTLRLEPGQSTQVPMSDGKKSVMARVEAQQRESVRTPSGTYRAIRYEAFLFNNVLFRRDAHLYVWLTDDARRLPVQIKIRMQFTVGTITLLLASQPS